MSTGERLHADTVATLRECAGWTMATDPVRRRLERCADRLEADAEREREAMAAMDELAAAAEDMSDATTLVGERWVRLRKAVEAWREFS